MQRLVSQQNDEVELVARLLASKIEQSQKVLATVAEGITAELLESPASLERPCSRACRPCASSTIRSRARTATSPSTCAISWKRPRAWTRARRDYLVRTLLDGKPLVSGLIGATPPRCA